MEKYTPTARRLGWTALATPLTGLSNLILLVVLTKKLPIADYGAWALILVTMGILPWVTTLGLPTAIRRFLAAEKDKGEIREAFYSMGLVVLAASSIVCGLLFLFASQIAASLFHNNITIALLLIPNILIACLTLYLLQYFTTFQQIKTYSLLVIFNAYLNTALIAILVLLGYGLEGAVIALLAQQLVGLALILYLIVAQIGITIPKFRRVRQYLAFGMPLVPANMAEWIVDSSDRYLVALFLGAAAVGYYSPGYNLGSTLSLIASPLLVLLLPLLSERYDDNKLADVRTILTYSLKYYSAIVIPCVFSLAVLAKPLLLVLTTQEIAVNGYLVTPIVAAGAALIGASTMFFNTLALKKRTALIGMIWAFSAVLNFGLNLVLIPYLGFIGAAITTFLAFLLAFLLTSYYALKEFRFDVKPAFIAKSVCGSSIIALFLLVWNPSGLLSIALSIALAAVIYLGILLVLRGLTIAEIQLIYKIYRGS
jgi:O-antigen/teichoic acid export membrane protein